eukprot:gene22501-biopygen31170
MTDYSGSSWPVKSAKTSVQQEATEDSRDPPERSTGLYHVIGPDKPGSIYSLQGGAWSEPNPSEKERMLGYYMGATAAPGLTQNQRHILTSNSMDQRALVAIIKKTLEMAIPTRLTSMLEFQPPPRPALLPSPSPVLLLTTSPSYPGNSGGRVLDSTPPTRQFYGTELACLLAVTRSKAVKPHIWPSQPQPPAPATSPEPSATSPQPLQHVPPSPLQPSSATSPPLAPCRQLDTDLRLAAMSKDTNGLDIHSDQFALEYLRRGVLGINCTTSRTRRGNGFVERSVGTIKAALTKICSEHLATDTWDVDIAKVVTAYNCSPQETTKCAPFTLLYARAPVMNNPEAQLAMTAQLPDLTDNTQVQALTDTLLERAQWIKRVSPTIANHIAIAHHRDTLRYANIKGGAYNPRLRKFQVGDFVYIRRPNVRNSLQMAAQGMILRIIDLKPTEVVVLALPPSKGPFPDHGTSS